MEIGFLKPLCAGQQQIPVDQELQNVHFELITKRKLTLIIRSNELLVKKPQVGDLVQYFVDDEAPNENHGHPGGKLLR